MKRPFFSFILPYLLMILGLLTAGWVALGSGLHYYESLLALLSLGMAAAFFAHSRTRTSIRFGPVPVAVIDGALLVFVLAGVALITFSRDGIMMGNESRIVTILIVGLIAAALAHRLYFHERHEIFRPNQQP